MTTPGAPASGTPLPASGNMPEETAVEPMASAGPAAPALAAGGSGMLPENIEEPDTPNPVAAPVPTVPNVAPPADPSPAPSASSTPEDETVPPQVSRPPIPLPPVGPAQLMEDVLYGEASGAKLFLDASVPESDGPWPSVILVHGGGWASGDKAKDITPLFEPLEGRFAWFSINYRMSGNHPWPACIEDVQTAIRWVKAHAAEYNGDPKRIAIIGHSAGGHLATLAANLPDEDARVQAAVGVAPVTDLVKDSERRGGLSSSLQKLFRLPKELTPDTRKLLAEWSPISFVHPGQPPVMMICGENDTTVPLDMCQDYQAALEMQGVPQELLVIEGGKHRITEWEGAAFQEQLAEWLWQTLR